MPSSFSPAPTISNNKITLYAVAIIAIYFISRSVLLLRLPAFIDEATHILWAQEMLQGNLTAGAYDGRWMTIQIFTLVSMLPLDPLLLARFTVVFAGSFTLIAIMLTAKELFSAHEALIAGLVYLLLPFSLFYDRLALADGLSLAFGAWSVYLSIRAIRSPTGYVILLLTISLIGCILTKTSGVVSITFPILAVVALLPRKEWRSGFGRIAPEVAAVAVVAAALWIRGAGTAGFFDKTPDGFPLNLALIAQNLVQAASWYWLLLTPILAVTVAVAIIWLNIKERCGEIWFLDLILIATVTPNILFLSIWYPRYLLFSLVPLCILISHIIVIAVRKALASHRKPLMMYVISVIFILSALSALFYSDTTILFRPERAPLPDKVRWQFLEGWPAGYGVSELWKYLGDEASSIDSGIWVMRFFNWDQTHQGVNLYQLRSKERQDESQVEFIQRLEPDMLTESGGYLVPQKPTYILVDRANSEAVALLGEFQPKMEAQVVWHHNRPGGFPGLEVWEILALPPDTI